MRWPSPWRIATCSPGLMYPATNSSPPGSWKVAGFVSRRRSTCDHGVGVCASEQAATQKASRQPATAGSGQRRGCAASRRTAIKVSSASANDQAANEVTSTSGCERPA